MFKCIAEYNQRINSIFDIDAYDSQPDNNYIYVDINKVFPEPPVKYAE